MRVYLATETLSKSVADSMEFLMLKGKKEFADCAATIRFIRIFDNIFDILNSKDVTKSMFKTAITLANYSRLFTYFEEAIRYIKSLRLELDGQRLLFSKRRTAFRGLIIDMVNTQSVYHKLIASNTIESLSTFRFSQDPLESLFGRIRSLNGYNDNPNEQQFCSALRKVTVNTEVTCSSFSNCVDSLNILTISSMKPAVNETHRFGVIEYLKYVDDNKEMQKVKAYESSLVSLENCSIAYIAGIIERKIENCESTG